MKVAKERNLRDFLFIGSLLLTGSFGAIAAAATPQASGAVSPAPPALAAATPSLPAGEGRDLMMRVCAACHTPEVVAKQRLTAEGWKEVVESMANNGAVATDPELEQITSYLARSFPAEGAAAQ
jgi:mono/diheme cytochrome c family protein